MKTNWIPIYVACSMGIFSLSASGELRYVGVNLSGAEFGSVKQDGGALPGFYGTNYTYPLQSEILYFRSKGMNTIRAPFRMERLQPTNNATLDIDELNRLRVLVVIITTNGMYIIFDPHNFHRYHPDNASYYSMQSGSTGLIGSAVPNSDFSNFWFRVAFEFKNNDHVIFGLMNEPNTMSTDQWISSANAAIAAIRNAGATNLILVPGNRWTGAWSWNVSNDSSGGINQGRSNADAMLDIIDPLNNIAFEVHQYLDRDSSGTFEEVMSSTIGVERLTDFTNWLKAHNRKGFLGEFAVPNSLAGNGQVGSEALTNMLSYIQTNSDVWLGWSWWSAGPWWGNYMFTLEPENLGQPNQTDRPAMAILKNLIPIPMPMLTVKAGNQVQFVAPPGFIYQPQFSTNITTGGWVNNGPSTNGNGEMVFSMSINSGQQGFYRVLVTRAP